MLLRVPKREENQEPDYLRLSINGGTPNGWFTMENPSINGWFRGTPTSGNLHVHANSLLYLFPDANMYTGSHFLLKPGKVWEFHGALVTWDRWLSSFPHSKKNTRIPLMFLATLHQFPVICIYNIHIHIYIMYNLIRHVNIRYTCTKSDLGLKNKCIQTFMGGLHISYHFTSSVVGS